ncbi:hypothetical protein [Streptomyces litchfieldiae]|uniref:Uncharacterized protein n=1 Tax=Streptomyces litchfieldiae TaxID=3075543 RepID=A0ABU2N4Q3_9ACTN|nr:hypothetical protein [Streptomyces sp. DSM 44938]MDT0347709.1 hypothetical protein [Streptomyces sp. DSM 44938]
MRETVTQLPIHRIAAHAAPSRVPVSLEVDSGTVRRGDQLVIGGQSFTVADLITLAPGRKRLHFTSGETLTMGPATVLWAARLIDPRLPHRRYR